MTEGRRRIPAEALVHLRRRLDTLPPRHPDRAEILQSARDLYGVSRATLYRALQQQLRPKALRRADRGKPRKIPATKDPQGCVMGMKVVHRFFGEGEYCKLLSPPARFCFSGDAR